MNPRGAGMVAVSGKQMRMVLGRRWAACRGRTALCWRLPREASDCGEMKARGKRGRQEEETRRRRCGGGVGRGNAEEVR